MYDLLTTSNVFIYQLMLVIVIIACIILIVLHFKTIPESLSNEETIHYPIMFLFVFIFCCFVGIIHFGRLKIYEDYMPDKGVLTYPSGNHYYIVIKKSSGKLIDCVWYDYNYIIVESYTNKTFPNQSITQGDLLALKGFFKNHECGQYTFDEISTNSAEIYCLKRNGYYLYTTYHWFATKDALIDYINSH